MKNYKANQPCPYGFYVSPGALDAHFVGADGESFAAKNDKAYYHLPNALLILISPLIGGLFVLAFPAIILGSFAVLATYSVGKLVWSFLMPRAFLLGNRWEPTMAYLTKPKAESEPSEKKANEMKDEQVK